MIRGVACLVVCVSGAVHGQVQFDVASIKLSNAASGSSGITTGHGRVTANNVTLKRCIMGAFGVGPSQIVGGPGWLDVDRFEIAAKAEKPTDDDAVLMAMLQSLLAERFKLTVHREIRPLSGFVLEVAKNGPKLEKTKGGDSATDFGHGKLDARSTDMDLFARVLGRNIGAPVTNQTGLEGAFDFKLAWTPEGDRAGQAPSIFTAVQEQLGLRLRAQKAPVEVLVIDRVEKPTEN